VKTVAELEAENAVLRRIVADVLPLARRYADRAASYVVPTVNEALRLAETVGVELPPDAMLCDPEGRVATPSAWP